MKHWGTKWGASDIDVVIYPMSNGVAKVVYKFRTAWSEPLALLDQVAKDHPGVKLQLKCRDEDGGRTQVTWKEGHRAK